MSDEDTKLEIQVLKKVIHHFPNMWQKMLGHHWMMTSSSPFFSKFRNNSIFQRIQYILCSNMQTINERTILFIKITLN